MNKSYLSTVNYELHNISLPSEFFCSIFILKNNFGSKIKLEEFQKINYAINYGKQIAKQIKENFPDNSLMEICERKNLILKNTENLFFNSFILAYFNSEDLSIYFDETKISLTDMKLKQMFNLKVDLGEIILSHEVFHFLTYQDLSFKKQGQKYIEIAGFSFVKEFLNLSYHPIFFLIARPELLL